MFNSRLIRTRSTRRSARSSACRTTAGRSPASRWPACRRKSSIRSARCLRGWPSKSALWSEGKLRICWWSARRRTAICRPIPGSASCRPAGAVPHRQGRPQIRLSPRRHHAASRRTRPDHPVAVLDLSSPCASPTSATRRSSARRSPNSSVSTTRLHLLDGQGRSDRLRRGRGHNHAAEVRAAGRQAHPRQPEEARGRGGGRRRRRRRPDQHRRALRNVPKAADEPAPSPNPSAPSCSRAIRATASPSRRLSGQCRTRTTSTSATG